MDGRVLARIFSARASGIDCIMPAWVPVGGGSKIGANFPNPGVARNRALHRQLQCELAKGRSQNAQSIPWPQQRMNGMIFKGMLDEPALVHLYMELTGSSETSARSVYMYTCCGENGACALPPTDARAGPVIPESAPVIRSQAPWPSISNLRTNYA